jgi:hypothetical protein
VFLFRRNVTSLQRRTTDARRLKQVIATPPSLKLPSASPESAFRAPPHVPIWARQAASTDRLGTHFKQRADLDACQSTMVVSCCRIVLLRASCACGHCHNSSTTRTVLRFQVNPLCMLVRSCLFVRCQVWRRSSLLLCCKCSPPTACNLSKLHFTVLCCEPSLHAMQHCFLLHHTILLCVTQNHIM